MDDEGDNDDERTPSSSISGEGAGAKVGARVDDGFAHRVFPGDDFAGGGGAFGARSAAEVEEGGLFFAFTGGLALRAVNDGTADGPLLRACGATGSGGVGGSAGGTDVTTGAAEAAAEGVDGAATGEAAGGKAK